MFDIFNVVNEEYTADEHMRNRTATQQAPSPTYSGAPASDVYVVSIGGSLIIDESGPNAEKIRAIADSISSLHSAGKRIVLVVGGGRSARSYVEAARSFTQNNFDLDILGIQITRVNALLVANAIPNAHKEILTDFSRARPILDSGKIPVFGGLMPFFTTDSVAALLAEHLNGAFVNLTNVDGIYDSNPNENPAAKRFDEIGYKKLVSLIVAAGSTPGQNVVLDLAACMILQRSRIPGVVLNGNDLSNFSNYVNGYSFTGTTIREIEGEVIEEPTFTEDMGKINVDVPQKKTRKKPKKSGKYAAPNPYQIDF
ncbi:MAG TPA: UMP kinase [archaeon]|nr:UMP kinase [archaeon]